MAYFRTGPLGMVFSLGLAVASSYVGHKGAEKFVDTQTENSYATNAATTAFVGGGFIAGGLLGIVIASTLGGNTTYSSRQTIVTTSQYYHPRLNATITSSSDGRSHIHYHSEQPSQED